MTAALALVIGLVIGVPVGIALGAALCAAHARGIAAQLDAAELNATIRAEAADQLVDDLEHAGRTITHIITGEHPTIPGNAA